MLPSGAGIPSMIQYWGEETSKHQHSIVRSRSESLVKDTDLSLVISPASASFCFTLGLSHPLPSEQLQTVTLAADYQSLDLFIIPNNLPGPELY